MAGIIVVVDDESEILDLVCVLLREEGYQALPFGHPSPVADLLAGIQPDLFLLDLMLPVMNGIELARELRLNGQPTTPMIAMSASVRLLAEARDSGLFDATLRKPFDLLELLQLVERAAA